MTIFDVTESIEKNGLKPQSPCTYCEKGWGSYSTFINKENGHKMIEIKKCSDTCSEIKIKKN